MEHRHHIVLLPLLISEENNLSFNFCQRKDGILLKLVIGSEMKTKSGLF